MKLTTTLKVAYFTGAKPVLCSVFRPISPYFILGLGSQKVVKSFSSYFIALYSNQHLATTRPLECHLVVQLGTAKNRMSVKPKNIAFLGYLFLWYRHLGTVWNTLLGVCLGKIQTTEKTKHYVCICSVADELRP